jgi:hypothetical protein
VAQTTYTHVSKCKNDKIKGEKIIKNKRKKLDHVPYFTQGEEA